MVYVSAANQPELCSQAEGQRKKHLGRLEMVSSHSKKKKKKKKRRKTPLIVSMSGIAPSPNGS